MLLVAWPCGELVFDFASLLVDLAADEMCLEQSVKAAQGLRTASSCARRMSLSGETPARRGGHFVGCAQVGLQAATLGPAAWLSH